MLYIFLMTVKPFFALISVMDMDSILKMEHIFVSCFMNVIMTFHNIREPGIKLVTKQRQQRSVEETMV